MTGPRALLLAAAWLVTAQAAAAGFAPGFRFLVRDDRVCDTTGTICLDMSIVYEPNARLLELYGRVAATTEPGVLVVVFAGHARDGTTRYAEMRIPLDGHYSEIARKKIIPDWPEIGDWAFDHARYEPADGEDGAPRR